MANKKDFIKAISRLRREAGLVQILEDSENDPEAFESDIETYADFILEEYGDSHREALTNLEIGSRRDRLNGARLFNYTKSKSVYKGLAGDIGELVDDLGDDLQKTAFGIIPIKENDLSKGTDKLKLDEIKENYVKKTKNLRSKLATIDRNTEPARYEALESAIQEYEGFAKLIKGNEDFVKKAAVYTELVSHTLTDKGRGNLPKMKELVEKELDKLSKKYKGKTDQIALGVSRALINNYETLKSYYAQLVLEPAEKELKDTGLAKDEKKMKKYIIDGVTSMNINRKANFFNGLYHQIAA